MTTGLAQAWRKAADDLAISVEAPAFFILDGERVQFDAHIRQFGGHAGTVVVAIHELTDERVAAAAAHGAFLSQLSLDVYGSYRRDLFINALADWGWFGGSADVPAWWPSSTD